MRCFLTILTIVMVFAHAVLGCCAHHEHACGQTHDQIGWVGGNCCADADPEHLTGSLEQSGHEHQGNDDCLGGKCDLGRPANEQVVISHLASSELVVVSPTLADYISACDYLGEHCSADGNLRPVRLHLVNQVMLI